MSREICGRDGKTSSRHRHADESRSNRRIKDEPKSPQRSPDFKRRRDDLKEPNSRHSASSSNRDDRFERPSSKWDERRGGRGDDQRRTKDQDHFRDERKHHERKRIDDKKQKEKSPEKQNWGKAEIKNEEEESEVPKEKPNFGTSGKLMEDTNLFKGIVIKYNEPPESRKPKIRWRLYPFKGDEALKVLYIHRQSAYLIGRERKIADIPMDHPSASKQHAVLQYRAVKYEREDGSIGKTIKPYIMDLGSANGTFLNNKKIDSQRYYELKEKDCLKFGFSTREYVLLHENSLQSEEGAESSDDQQNDKSITDP